MYVFQDQMIQISTPQPCIILQMITFDEEVAIKAAQATAIAAAAKQAEKQKDELPWEDQACTRCNSKVGRCGAFTCPLAQRAVAWGSLFLGRQCWQHLIM